MVVRVLRVLRWLLLLWFLLLDIGDGGGTIGTAQTGPFEKGGMKGKMRGEALALVCFECNKRPRWWRMATTPENKYVLVFPPAKTSTAGNGQWF